MKRLIYILFSLSIFLFTGCESTASGETETEQNDKINIVATVFPQYDWTRQIIGEENWGRFNITQLIDSRVDLHSFSPSVSDVITVKQSDVFIYIGGHSDGWVEPILRDANPNMLTLNLMEQLNIDELLEGFCDEDCDEDHDHNFAGEGFLADEHVWLSLRFAQTLCQSIADILSEADPENAATYQANARAYIEKLSALDAEYQAVVESASIDTLVFADRFPFRYLMNDYGLTHYAAFQGCSAESEASFVTIISLANRINQLGLNVVMVTETSDHSIAQTVINSTNEQNQKILTLDGMKTVTPADISNGVTYLSIMENNLAVLKEALN